MSLFVHLPPDRDLPAYLHVGRPTWLRPADFFAVPLQKLELLQNEGRFWVSVLWGRDSVGSVRRRFVHVFYGSDVAVAARLWRHYGGNARHLETRMLHLVPEDREIALLRCPECDGAGTVSVDTTAYYMADLDDVDVRPDSRTEACAACYGLGWTEEEREPGNASVPRPATVVSGGRRRRNRRV